MNVTRVESSTLATVGYDHDHELLRLEFCSGVVYQYFAVPAAVHEALLAAASKGSYFNRAIRNRYRFCRVARLSRPGGAPDAVLGSNPRSTAWPAR